jgi:hypothetical protein
MLMVSDGAGFLRVLCEDRWAASGWERPFRAQSVKFLSRVAGQDGGRDFSARLRSPAMQQFESR